MSAEGTSAGGPAVHGGNRRIDRVLAVDYLDGLREAPLAGVRGLRREAEQEEVDLSYVRRLLQGRLDVLRAEQARRRDGSGDLVAGLAKTLADEPRGPARGLGRYTQVEPSRVDEHRRHVERLVADVDLSDVSARTDDDLEQALQVFIAEEQVLSATRKQVQAVMDACGAEMTRRYRDGEADVADLLPPAAEG